MLRSKTNAFQATLMLERFLRCLCSLDGTTGLTFISKLQAKWAFWTFVSVGMHKIMNGTISIQQFIQCQTSSTAFHNIVVLLYPGLDPKAFNVMYLTLNVG